MKLLEKLLPLGILIGLILKIFLIAGGSLVFSLSITLLACLYFPLGIAFFNDISLKDFSFSHIIKINPSLRIFEALFVGIGLGIICTGILFKLQEWPFSQLEIAFGLIITLVFFIFSGIKYLKNRNIFYKRIFKRIYLIAGFGLVIYLLPPLTIIKFQYRDYPDYVKAYENYLSDPGNERLKVEKDIQYYKIVMSEEEFKSYLEYEHIE